MMAIGDWFEQIRGINKKNENVSHGVTGVESQSHIVLGFVFVDPSHRYFQRFPLNRPSAHSWKELLLLFLLTSFQRKD